MRARVLVIEDNPANMEVMTYLLRAYKYETMAAESGEAGLALAQKERPDVVVCDIHLPGIDGFEVVRQLKADPATRSTPVVAVTAFAMVGDRERALAAGFDGYIGKPIVPETFVSQIEQFLNGQRSAAPAAHAAAPGHAAAKQARHAGARIIVVDNMPANRELIASTLRPFGYEVVLAGTVASALDSARITKPDLIISDLHMPGVDGHAFLEQVKADAGLRDVPFMFASATTWNQPEQRSALQRGADLFLLRPIEPQAMLDAVEGLLDKSRSRHGDDPGR